MERKDYYKIMELSEEDKNLPKDKFLEKLRKNFKRLAIKYHPDRNPGNKEAENKFKDINEANQVLSDYDGKKAEYDNPMSNFTFSGNMDMDEILKHFGFDMFGGMDMGFGSHNMTSRPSVIHGTVGYNLEDVLNGTEKKIRFKKTVICDSCHGSGNDRDTHVSTCPYCHGTGFMVQNHGMMQIRQTCPHCHGSGRIISNPCKKCGGEGFVYETDELTFNVPRGVYNGQRIILRGVGNQINGQVGDVEVVFTENPHPVFKRISTTDIECTIDVGVIDALLGCSKKVRTLDGKILDITIPQCSENGKRLRVRGYGLPYGNSSSRGDMVCVVRLTMPKSLSEKDIAKLREVKELKTFKG